MGGSLICSHTGRDTSSSHPPPVARAVKISSWTTWSSCPCWRGQSLFPSMGVSLSHQRPPGGFLFGKRVYLAHSHSSGARIQLCFTSAGHRHPLPQPTWLDNSHITACSNPSAKSYHQWTESTLKLWSAHSRHSTCLRLVSVPGSPCLQHLCFLIFMYLCGCTRS